MKFKLFSGYNIPSVEKEINDWLSKNQIIETKSQSLTVTNGISYVQNTQPAMVNGTWLEYTIMITY